MDTVEETRKRMEITGEISPPLEGICRGVLLGGSMGFGQNYSVTEKSDIDMVVVMDIDKIRELESLDYFYGNIPVLGLFENRIINLIRVEREMNEIKFDHIIYETRDYIDFCLLKGKLKGYNEEKPNEFQTQNRFDGSEITFSRKVRPYGNGFLYEKPALADGKFWGGPPRSDFLTGSVILYEADNFFTSLDKEVWKKTIEQMVKEYGKDLDLNKVNVLNSDFKYQRNPEKLPKEIINKIQSRTKEELRKYLSALSA